MKKSTNKFVMRVTNSDEYFDESSDAAVVAITPYLKELLFKAREQMKRIKAEFCSEVYDIRIFDNHPTLLGSGEFYDIGGAKITADLESNGPVNISDALHKKVEKTTSTVRVETVLLQVSEDSFFWTGYYKHTNVRFTTGAIPFEAIEKV